MIPFWILVAALFVPFLLGVFVGREIWSAQGYQRGWAARSKIALDEDAARQQALCQAYECMPPADPSIAHSKPSTPSYREGWERIFGTK